MTQLQDISIFSGIWIQQTEKSQIFFIHAINSKLFFFTRKFNMVILRNISISLFHFILILVPLPHNSRDLVLFLV